MAKFQVNNERSANGDKFSTTGATVGMAVAGGALAYWLGDGSGLLTAGGAAAGAAGGILWDPGKEEREQAESQNWRKLEHLVESAKIEFPDADDMALAQIRVGKKVKQMEQAQEAAEKAQIEKMGKAMKAWLKSNPS